MTAYSANGWPANDRSLIATYTVPGTSTRIAMRIGDVSVILLDWLSWFNANIEPLDGGVMDDWGYAERAIRGGTALSNHSSGSAADMNATRHPLGVPHTFTPAQAAAIHARLYLYGGVLRWGGDYSGRVDEMHVEINAGSAAVAAVANAIRAGQFASAPPQEEDEDMARIMRATGKMDALQDGPLFLGLNAEESKNLQASGLKVVWINSSTWDALARAQAVGQPYGHNVDGDPAKA